MPSIFSGQPKGKVRADQGERRLLSSELQINTAAGGLNVGKTRALFSAAFGGWRAGDLSYAQQQGLDVPMPVGVHKIQAGRSGVVRELEVGDLQPAMPQRSQAQVGGDLAAYQ